MHAVVYLQPHVTKVTIGCVSGQPTAIQQIEPGRIDTDMEVSLTDGVHALDGSAESRAAWNAYAGQCGSASFYHRFEWKRINEDQFGHRTWYLACVADGRINGILPLTFIESRLFGRILCSLPFLNYCGPAADSAQAEQLLLQRAYRIADEEKADYLEIRSMNLCDESLPRSENKVSMTIALPADADEAWNAFKSKHRTNIRRVYKSGIRVVAGHLDLLDPYYDIISRSWRDLGTPLYRKRYFRSILEAFGEDARIYLAYQGDQPVATAFNGHFDKTVEGMWAGALPESRRLQTNYVLYWEMIKAACQEGFDHFHLGRSSADSGAESFKRKWNATTSQLYWLYYLPDGGSIPQLNVNNPKYSLAINVWRKLPLAVVNMIGPSIARNIP